MRKSELKKLAKIAADLADIEMDFDTEFVDDHPQFSVDDYSFTLGNLKDIHKLSKLSYEGIAGSQYFQRIPGDRTHYTSLSKIAGTLNYKELFTTVSQEVFDHSDILGLVHPPVECLHDGVTYRIMQSKNNYDYRTHVYSHEEPEYVYLDKGHILRYYIFDNEIKRQADQRIAITDSLNFDTGLILLLLAYNIKFFEYLENNCFINSKKAALIRLRMEKGLTDEQREEYTSTFNGVNTRYASDINVAFFNKVVTGEVNKGEFFGVELTKDKASYQTVTIEYPNLLEVVKHCVNVKEQFDIYGLIKLVTSRIVDQFEATSATDMATFNGTIVINNIPITLSYQEKSGVRCINGFRIKKDELAQVIYRASCFTRLEDYNNFLKQTSIMNLACTDALRAGLPMKIDRDYSSYARYSDPIAHSQAPKLWFKIVDKKVHLIVSENVTIPIKFTSFVKRALRLNVRTTNNYSRHAYTRYDYSWARQQLAGLIQNSTRYNIPLRGEDGVVLKNAEGKEMSTMVQHFQAKDWSNFIMFIDDKHNVAFAKSKDFLKTAITKTGATTCTYKSEMAYLVKGTLRSYIVTKEKGEVFDAHTKQYICIVDASEQGVGYDRTAARLYALKNDSVLVSRIDTLDYENSGDINAEIEGIEIENSEEAVV